MTTIADLERAREAIRARWDSDSGLKECRGYVFNLAYVGDAPVNATEPADAVVMGMNPGEDLSQPGAVSKRSETRWRNECSAFASAVGRSWAISEMFFWSSNDLGVLAQRIGDLRPHLEFCAALNRLMLDFHRPAVVYQPGLRWRSYAVDYYGLRHARTMRSDRTGGVLLEHYDLPDGTPWLSTPHWTAARGLKAEDKAAMRAYAASVSRPSRQPSPAGR